MKIRKPVTKICLKLIKSFSIYQSNLQVLMTEIYEIANGLAPPSSPRQLSF